MGRVGVVAVGSLYSIDGGYCRDSFERTYWNWTGLVPWSPWWPTGQIVYVSHRPYYGIFGKRVGLCVDDYFTGA